MDVSRLVVRARGPLSVKTFLLSAMMALGGVHASSEAVDLPDLGRYLWRQRVLVLSAPSADDPRLLATRRSLDEQACEVAERDIVVLEVVGGAGYAIRLVGKDGGVKLRRGAPVPLEEIFALVDAMPKRRVEIGTRPRPAGC